MYLVVAVLVDGPGAAASHNDGLGLVVIIKLSHVVVQKLFAADEKVPEVEIQHVILPAVGRAGESQARRHVVEGGGHVGAVVVAVGPPIGGAGVIFVVIVVGIEQPHTSEAAGGDPVFKYTYTLTIVIIHNINK